jgi:hypothetical protein
MIMEITLLAIDRMHDRYPNQWLLVANTKTDENLELLKGEVIAHSTDCDQIYTASPVPGGVANARERKTRTGNLSIEYTGIIPDNFAFIL